VSILRVVAISDTHGTRPDLPDGDVLIHAGDCSLRGSEPEIARFGDWLEGLPHRIKLFVPGNHDWLFEVDRKQAEALIPDDVTTLIDESFEVDGLRVYGSPRTPRFGHWAFMYDQKNEDAVWAPVPEKLHVLVTHGPAFTVLDQTASGKNVGCFGLAKRLEEVRPRFHVFGHIHEDGGREATETYGKAFNVAWLDDRYNARPGGLVRTFDVNTLDL
jgi:Icc-related predicted phosphoesterase